MKKQPSRAAFFVYYIDYQSIMLKNIKLYSWIIIEHDSQNSDTCKKLSLLFKIS